MAEDILTVWLGNDFMVCDGPAPLGQPVASYGIVSTWLVGRDAHARIVVTYQGKVYRGRTLLCIGEELHLKQEVRRMKDGTQPWPLV